MKLNDVLENKSILSESKNLNVMLHNMKKYKMEITSFGTGLGISFVDEEGKEHYEESSAPGSNTDGKLTIEAMVDFAMSEITYRHNNKKKSVSEGANKGRIRDQAFAKIENATKDMIADYCHWEQDELGDIKIDGLPKLDPMSQTLGYDDGEGGHDCYMIVVDGGDKYWVADNNGVRDKFIVKSFNKTDLTKVITYVKKVLDDSSK